MRLRPTKLNGFLVIDIDLRTDRRGSFGRTFCRDEFSSAGVPFEVVQANISVNPHQHTLRGMHFQEAPHGEPKVVLCTHGRVFDVAVDIRPNSQTYLQWESVELGLEEGMARSVCIAPGLAHGFLTLEPDSSLHYLMGAPYVPGSARGIRWDDPAIGIRWPQSPQALSARDATFPLIDRVRNPFT